MAKQAFHRYKLLTLFVFCVIFSLLLWTHNRPNVSETQENRILLQDSNCIQCQDEDPKVTKLAFAKTHKTGSSTLQNIFLRFGVNHDLNFVFPQNSWMFSLLDPWNVTEFTAGPWKDLTFDIFTAHSLWDHNRVRSLIPEAKFVTILRHPVAVYESLFVYMGVQKQSNMTLDEYVVKRINPKAKRIPETYIGKNPLLWDLGLNVNDMEEKSKVEAKIKRLEEEFDLVMITEKFSESMVLLKELLHWDLEDVLYMSQNIRVQSQKSTLSKETEKFLKEWMWADMMLYEHFAKKFEKRIEEFGPERMTSQVADLEARNQRLLRNCTVSEVGMTEKMGEGAMVNQLVSSEVKPFCGPFTWRETDFVKLIRGYQSAKVIKMRLRGEIP